MIRKAYVIKDNKANVFHTPFFANHDVMATRQFHSVCKDNTLQMAMFPEDFDMYYLGEYDDQSAKMNLLPQPEYMISATAFVNAINKGVDK